MIHMFKYCEGSCLDNLVRVIIWRLSFEELQVEAMDIKWILSQAMAEKTTFGERDYIILFGSYPQNQWLSALVTLQLRQVIGSLTVADRTKLQNDLTEVENTPILRLLSLKLKQQKTCVFELDDIKAIFENSKRIELDNEISAQLLAIGVGAWPLRLLWLDTVLQISLFKVKPEMEEEDLEEVSYYMGEIRQKYGDSHCSELLNVLSGKTDPINKPQLKTALRNLYRNKWVLDEKTIRILRDEASSDWNILFSKNVKSDKLRDIDNLVNIMKDYLTNSDTVQNMLSSCKAKVTEIEKHRSSLSQVCTHSLNDSLQSRKISQYSENDVKYWIKTFSSPQFLTTKSDYMAEIVCIVDRAIQITRGFSLRTTQILAVVIFIETGKTGILEQISTGEGKCLIIATLAIYKALVENKNIDIITSSVVLAERDAKENRRLYEVFGLTVEHNNVDEIQKRTEVYTNSHVIYGDISCFQRDLLLDTFYNVGNGIGSRKIGCVIVDEVDSMLIDKGSNTLYLSRNIPGMDALEPLYVHMWHMAHARGITGSEKDIDDIERATRQAMCPLLLREELHKKLEQTEEKTEQIWEELIRLKLINKHGEIVDGKQLLNTNGNLQRIYEIKIELENKEKGKIVSLLKDSIRRGIYVEIPNNLKEFVELHLKDWAKNALLARMMNVNEDYIIDIDRSDNARRTEPNIVIMDNYTGAEQYSSQWSSGLHQFLQLKHSCRLSMESLKAVFISNTKFFERYGTNLFGLSGTLGSQSERKFLKNIYGVDFCVIPTFKESRFIESTPALFRCRDTWLKHLAHECIEITHEKQAVLIICEHIDQVNLVEAALKKLKAAKNQITANNVPIENSKKQLDCPLHVYTRSYEPIVGSDEEIKEPCVIISTNLAGRGTDIKVSEELSKQGGLHVCVAYLPPSVRIEEQAFGRTARKGQNGSGQIICCDETESSHDKVISFAKLKTNRDQNEAKHVNELESSYKNYTKPEEILLEKFRDKYQALSQHMSSKPKVLKDIVLNNCLDSWAFWLDEIGSNYTNDLKNAPIDEFLKKISDAIKNDNCEDQIIDRSASKIEYANFIEGDEGLKKFQTVIEDDCHYRVIAQYYTAHLLIQKMNPRTEKDCQDSFKNLRSALISLKERQNKLGVLVASVAQIARSYANTSPSFALVNDYEAQKQDITGVLEVFIDSIRNILGAELTINLIQSTKIDPIRAKKLLEALIKTGVVDRPRVVSKQWSEKTEKYKLYTREIDNFLVENETKEIQREALRELLPSRENFWEEMKKCEAIKDERVFVLLDKEAAKTALEEYYPDLHKKLENSFKKNDNSKTMLLTVSEKKIYLYHEQLEDIIAGNLIPLTRSEFEERVGSPEEYRAMFDQDILRENCTAILTNNVSLKKFSRVTKDSFLSIDGVDENVALDIMYEMMYERILNNYLRKMQTVNYEKLKNYNLKCYPEFQSEFESCTEKDLSYASCLQKLRVKPDDKRFIELPVMPWLELWDDLVDIGCIKPMSLNKEISEDKKTKEIVKSFFNEDEIAEDDIDKFVDNLCDRLEQSISHLKRFDRPTSNLKPLESVFENRLSTPALSSEVNKFVSGGYTGIIIISLKRTPWQKLKMVLPIILIGVAQIALGVFITIMSAGVMSLVGSNVIGEGISDLLFAAECFYSGHFSWKMYAKHKVISLFFSVCTLGLGMYFSRGAQMSKFGYKIGGEAMARLVGKELAEAVGAKVVAKTVASNVARKLCVATVNFATSRFSDVVANKCEEQMRNGVQFLIEKRDFSKLKSEIEKNFDRLGPSRTQEHLDQTIRDVFESSNKIKKMYSQVSNFAPRAFSLVQKGMQHSSAKGRGVSSEVNSTFALIQKGFKFGKLALDSSLIIIEVQKKISNIESKFRRISEEAEQTDAITDASTTHITAQEMASKFIQDCKDHLAKYVSHEFAQDIVKPAAEMAMSFAVKLVYSKTKQLYEERQIGNQRLQFEKLKMKVNSSRETLESYDVSDDCISKIIHACYSDEMIKLLETTKSPDLYAEMVDYGFPVGAIALQGAAEIAKTNLQIKTLDGELVMEVGKESNTETKAVFFDKETQLYVTSSGSKSTCIIEAFANNDVKVTREQFTAALRTNTELRACVSSGAELNLHKKLRGNQANAQMDGTISVRAKELDVTRLSLTRVSYRDSFEVTTKRQSIFMNFPNDLGLQSSLLASAVVKGVYACEQDRIDFIECAQATLRDAKFDIVKTEDGLRVIDSKISKIEKNPTMLRLHSSSEIIKTYNIRLLESFEKSTNPRQALGNMLTEHLSITPTVAELKSDSKVLQELEYQLDIKSFEKNRYTQLCFAYECQGEDLDRKFQLEKSQIEQKSNYSEIRENVKGRRTYDLAMMITKAHNTAKQT